MRLSKRIFTLSALFLAAGGILGTTAYHKLRIDHLKEPSALQAGGKSSSARPPEPPSMLRDLQFESRDNRALDDSRSLELIGKTGTGVNAVEVWSSCDDDAHKLKNFNLSERAFSYKASLLLGNVCRGHNDYVVKVFGIKDGAQQMLAEKNISLESAVGIRSQPDLSVLRFMDSHTLSAARSIESRSLLPKRIFPSPEFRTACLESRIFSGNTPVEVYANVAVDLDVISGNMPSTTGQNVFQAQTSWFDHREGTLMQSAAIIPYPLGACDSFSSIEVWSPTHDRAFVQQGDSVRIQFFNGQQWTNAREHLLRLVPIDTDDLHSLRLAVTENEFSLSETNETRNGYSNNQSDLFTEQRGEYLFSLNDGAFLGVVWHRRR